MNDVFVLETSFSAIFGLQVSSWRRSGSGEQCKSRRAGKYGQLQLRECYAIVVVVVTELLVVVVWPGMSTSVVDCISALSSASYWYLLSDCIDTPQQRRLYSVNNRHRPPSHHHIQNT
jgi:hypothetical protein